jgi:spermidine synthase
MAVAVWMGKAPGATVEAGRRVLLSPHGAYTVSMLDGGRTGMYYDSGEVLGLERPEMKRVVLLGLGGGEMLRAARRTLPKAELIGVELDPKVAQAARQDFRVGDFGVKVVEDDAAPYMDRAVVGSIDGVMVDVYDDDVIPLYFRSPVFFRSCRRALSPRGLLLMNVYPASLADAVTGSLEDAGFSSVRRGVAGPNVVLLAER